MLDTFNSYGGGKKILDDGDCVWYVQNNGADGDDWACNNYRTGGAGAIAWRARKSPELDALLAKITK